MKKSILYKLMYDINDVMTNTSAIMKYIKALCCGDILKANDIIWATAAMIPPNDCPLTTAAMYSFEKRLAIPTKPPMNTALAAEKKVFEIRIFVLDLFV